MTTIQIQASPKLNRTFFKKYSNVVVLADENTSKHCYGLVSTQLPQHTLISIPAGEQHKNLDTCKRVWQGMTDAGLDRHSLLIALGGGVVGDLGGFCASTFKRGIDVALMPTTLLSMADASIGGKTGIDFGPLKNHIGTFFMPVANWIVTDFLRTLPKKELRSGFAEIIKHTLMGDRKQWNRLRQKDLGSQDIRALIRQSVAYKSAIVKKDPHEIGLRKVLNFGHTIGHALEGFYIDKGTPVLHGEAIAAGMIVEASISAKRKWLSGSEFDQVSEYIIGIFGIVELPGTDKLLPAILQDKKNKGKTILMALPRAIGKPAFDVPVSEAEIRDAVGFYQALQT